MTTPRVMTGRRWALAAIVASLAACGDGSVPRAGDPDPRFGDAGEAIIDLGVSRRDFPAGVAVLPDGRIIVGGRSCAEDCAFAVTRVLPDGTLDPSFGTGGFTLTHFGPVRSARAEAMAVQPDGKIVLVGSVDELIFDGGTTGFGLARYLPDGALDPSFGTGGVVATRPRGEPPRKLIGTLAGVALQTDGKIVVVGTLIAQAFGEEGGITASMVVARYRADGTLDAGFGTDGLAVPDDPRFAAASGHAIVIQSSGRIVAAGSSGNRFVLVGLDRDGRVDASFGDGGAVVTVVADEGDYEAVALGANDAIVAPIDRFRDEEDAIVRYDADGRLETGYGGLLAQPFKASALAVVGDEVLLTGSTFASAGPFSTFALLRLRADGTPDPTFALGGFTTTKTPSFHPSSRPSFVAVDARGRIVVAGVVERPGENRGDLLLARFLR